jgi:hypothetical protein
MASLQIILLVAGLALVSGVFFYNYWQERSVKRHFSPSETRPEEAPNSVFHDTIDPSVTRAEPHFQQLTDAPDYMTETILVLNLPQTFRITSDLAQQILMVPGKHVRVLWQARGMSGWVPLTDTTSVVAFMNEVPAMEPDENETAESPSSSLAFCLLLADRANVTTMEQLDGFQKHVNNIASLLGATYTPFDASVEAERAHALDKVCAQLDAQIALTITGKVGPMPNPQFYLAAKKQGFVLERGALRFRVQGAEIFRIEGHNGEPLSEDRMNTKAIQNPLAYLDIPRVHDPVGAFDEMVRQVLRLAQNMSAQIMNDVQKPISERDLATLRLEIQNSVQTMRATGVEPGSGRALRLFNS